MLRRSATDRTETPPCAPDMTVRAPYIDAPHVEYPVLRFLFVSANKSC